MKVFVNGLNALLSAFSNAKDNPATPKTADVLRLQPTNFVGGNVKEVPGASSEKFGEEVRYRSVHGQPTKALELVSTAYAVEPSNGSSKVPRRNIELRLNYHTVYGENDAVMGQDGYLDKEIPTIPSENGYVKVQWHHIGQNPPDKETIQIMIDQTYAVFKTKPVDGTHDADMQVLTHGQVQSAVIPGIASYGS